MLYKNSLKLIFSNFSLIWKVLLYLLIATLICVGIGYLVALPTINLLNTENLFQSIKEHYISFVETLDLKNLFTNIASDYNGFVSIIVTNFSKIWLSVVAFCFVVIVLICFLNGLYMMPASIVLYQYMASGTKKSFTASFIESFKKNLIYSLVYLITLLPIRIFTSYICINLFLIISNLNSISWIIAPFFTCLIFILLSALRITFFCGWIPAQLTMDMGVFKSIGESFRTSNRRLFKVFSNSIGLIISIIFINVFALICTFGVGLIISIPVSAVWFSTYNMVSFYTAYGMKFYIDPYNFMSPKKRELTEKKSKLKYLY